jgi:hypothetical protein
LSGTISPRDLPADIDRDFFIYELTLRGRTPNPTFLRTNRDLEGFRLNYQAALAAIMRNHGMLKDVYLFPAVPAPIAILCGRELLPKVHPGLLVYDFDKRKVGFTYQLKVNNHDN